MGKRIYDNGVLLFSFFIGFLSFFALKERRVDAVRKKMFSKSIGEDIRHDWVNVGRDLSKSFDRFTKA